jgi:hypothetical protein
MPIGLPEKWVLKPTVRLADQSESAEQLLRAKAPKLCKMQNMLLTHFLARLIGLFLLSIGVSLLFQKKVFLGVLNDITENRHLLFGVGVILFVCGIAIVLSHNVWRGGFLSTVITLIGWVLSLRGLISMFLPGDSVARIVRLFKVEEFSSLYAVFILLVGAYLTYAGFMG